MKNAASNPTDDNDNNVFHYIGDLSSEHPEKAIEIFSFVVKFADDTVMVRQMVVKTRNSSNLTAIEYTAKYGSPRLLRHMLKLIQHTAFAVGPNVVSFGLEEGEDYRSDEMSVAKNKLELVDVSMYEGHSIKNLSTLLNLLSDREVIEMSHHDVQLFCQVSSISKWIKIKTKQLFYAIGCLHLLDIVITAFMVYIIMSDPIRAPSSVLFSAFNARRGQVIVNEIEAQSKNESIILQNDAFPNVRNKMQKTICHSLCD